MEANASDGDRVIILPAGTYRLTHTGADEDAALTGDLDVTDLFNTLVIRGAGPGLSITNGEGSDRVFQVLGATTLHLEGVTVVNGSTTENGGGIWNGGTLRMSNSVVSFNTGADGGGIYNRASAGRVLGAAGTVELTDVRVRGNVANGFGGGGIWNGGNLEWSGGELLENSTGLDGGGLLNRASAALTNVTVSDNGVGSGVGGIVNFGGDLTVIGATISGNTASFFGGGVSLFGGSAAISDSLIAFNSAPDGGGVLASGLAAPLAITNSVIRDNSGRTGQGIKTSVSLTMIDSTLRQNVASGSGGGLFVAGNTTRVTNTVLADNTAEGRGGGLHIAAGIVTMQAGSITGNRSVKSVGGGIAIDMGAEIEISGATVASNIATEGAGILSNGTLRRSQTMVTANVVDVSDADTTFFSLGNGGGLLLQSGGFAVIDDGSVIRDNVAGTGGGGIVTFASLTIIDSTVSGNTASSGGGGIVVAAGATTLTRTIVSDNTSGFGGGGLRVFDGTLTLTDSSVTGNTASGEGGGIAMEATAALEVRGTTIAANSGAAGGGVHARGPVVIVDSTLSGNSAGVGGGGGIWVIAGSSSITNSTISGNTTTDAGGGIETREGAALTLLNNTIANNTAITGGGIAQLGGSIQIRNTIVAANTPADCLGTVVSIGSNLGSDGSCSLIALTDVPSVDARLAPLNDNGGDTETHALGAGSPAIDAGNDAVAPPTDQRGLPRLG